MYFVYKITNIINNKKYFGSTNDTERRWREHKSHSQNINSTNYNYPLQKALRKYGISNFLFEILPQKFNTRYEAEEYEKEMIIKYNTYGHDGYNQTFETHNALTDGLIRDKLKNKIIGFNLNNIKDTLIFSSVSDAARAMKTERGSISKCANGNPRYTNVKGYIWRYLDQNDNIIECDTTIQQVIEEYNRKNPIINGERHTIKEWCSIYNISTASYYYRIKQGWSIIDALTRPKKGE